MKDIKEEIEFLKELGFNSQEIYEILVLEQMERTRTECAPRAKDISGMDPYHKAIEFGYYI